MNIRKVSIGIICVLVVAVVALLLYRNYRAPQVSDSSDSTTAAVTTLTSDAASVEAVQNPGAAAVSAPATGQKAAPAKLSYTEAVKKYTDRRIQFDANCQAVPNNVAYKNGTEIMFDNRAGISRKILFNTKSYTIPAYGFIIVAASSQTLPGITYIDCGDRQNVGKVLIQK